MSVEAISWALRQPIQHSTAKFVLVVMANYADGDMFCWPSVASLCENTSQDRKTVMANIQRLCALGYIEDTGYRKGTTKQIVVYRLIQIPKQVTNPAEEDEREKRDRPENGTVKQSQKRNSTENGTVPIFPANSTVFPVKESRFSAETVPKTGHGYIKEPLKEPSRNQIQKKGANAPPFDALGYLLALGVDAQIAGDWLAVRKVKKAAPSKTAFDRTVREIEKAGMSLGDGLEVCCARGWAAFEAKWVEPDARASPSRPDQAAINAANNAKAKELLFGKNDWVTIDER